MPGVSNAVDDRPSAGGCMIVVDTTHQVTSDSAKALSLLGVSEGSKHASYRESGKQEVWMQTGYTSLRRIHSRTRYCKMPVI